MQNLGQFLKKNSQKHKNRIAYQIKRGLRTQRFSFGDVYSLARKTATFLQEKGLKNGEKVAIWAPNMPEYPILYFACWLVGVISIPIDVRTTEETLKNFLTKAKCKVGFKSKFIPVGFGKLVNESFYLEDLIDLVKDSQELAFHPKDVRLSDLAEIAFTSGTTGTPKGVMLTHGNFLSDIKALTAVFPFRQEYQTFSILPLSHAFEQVVDFLVPYQTGITVTYLERINALTILQVLRKNKITSIALVPQVLQLLMRGIEQEVENQGKTSEFNKVNKIAPYLPVFLRRLIFKKIHEKLGGKLQFFGCGSAPLDLKLAQKWEALGIEIFEGYGATETTAALTINTPQSKRLGSVGKVLPGMEVKLDPKTNEILASGSNISPGYFEDEEKTKAVFQDDWYRTGDVGEFDKDGFLYITGREAFRIVLPNGQKVYPEDLEKKLNTHQLVVESCVVGVKHEEGEVVHAVVVTKSPQKLNQVIKDINQQLASHEQILEWSVWKSEDFPRTPILKIDRRRVLETVSWVSKPETGVVEVKAEDKLTSLIAQVTKISLSKIKENSILTTDLKLDSLGRVGLLSLIEQEYGVAISETKINPQTTVVELRKLIKTSPNTITIDQLPINETVYSPLLAKIRVLLQTLIFFPLHAFFVPLKIKGKENLRNLKLPVIFYFNHIGILDGICIMRILPGKLREKLVLAASTEFWEDNRRGWMEWIGGAFPFDKKERVKASLELTGEFIDQGFSILLAPEGAVTKQGKILPFKSGIGLLAVEMQIPVVPVKIDFAYREVFEREVGKSFRENLPKKRRRVTVSVGKPLTFPKDTPYEEAAEKMREELIRL